MQHLKVLSVPVTEVTNAGIAAMARAPVLEELFAGGLPRVDDQGIRSLCKHQTLRKLYLPGDPVTDAIVPCLAEIPLLEEVGLGTTRVTKRGTAELQKRRPTLKFGS